jgi:hypothetical protein
MTIIRYTNSEGLSVDISRDRPFILENLEGFGPVQNEIKSSQMYGLDGAAFVDDKLVVRDMAIEGTIVAESNEQLMEYRQTLAQIFNPKINGTLYFEEHGNKYMIDVEVEHGPNFDLKTYNIAQKFQLLLKALDPYWRDTSVYDSLIPLSRVENKFKFPLILTDDFVFASLVSGEIIEVDNSGSVEVGGIFRMKLNGEVTNPRIYNVLTQEYFGFQGTYPAGTEFEINTIRGSKKVTKNIDGVSTNSMSERMPESTFLQIKKGANYFQIQVDDEVNLVIGTLNFTPLVLGV